MHLQLLTTLATALSLASNAVALGLNCRGSLWCSGKGTLHHTKHSQEIAELIDTIHGDKWAWDGQQIACYSGFCAFYQHTSKRLEDGTTTNGGSIARAKELVWEIVNHGCVSCGSCPTDYPWSNNVKDGELTINFVQYNCVSGGHGVCPELLSPTETAEAFLVARTPGPSESMTT